MSRAEFYKKIKILYNIAILIKTNENNVIYLYSYDSYKLKDFYLESIYILDNTVVVSFIDGKYINEFRCGIKDYPMQNRLYDYLFKRNLLEEFSNLTEDIFFKA